jgi:hypothetical protein
MDALKNQQIMIAKEKKGDEYVDKGQKYCLLTDQDQMTYHRTIILILCLY